MYEVYLESKAERDLKRLSPSSFSQIIAHVKALAKNPRPKGSHKLAIQKSISVYGLESIEYSMRFTGNKRKLR